ncbi:MAG TPA: hypothetical protein VGS08_00465 [Candidatus Saccharimonadales bacterium]|nr:hypothetical protein [Candidatus Saccharimonadales bacterium]
MVLSLTFKVLKTSLDLSLALAIRAKKRFILTVTSPLSITILSNNSRITWRFSSSLLSA